LEYTESVDILCHSEGARRPKNLTSQGSRDPSLSLRVTNGGSRRITVLGIGNLLLKDEGVGVHLVQKLAGLVDDVNIQIIDAGTYPDFVSLVSDNQDKLIIVDAVKTGDGPGTIYRFSLDDSGLADLPPLSVHDMGVLDSLRTLAFFNKQPKSTVVIGIEPKTIDFGLDLSPEIEKKLPEIIDLVLKEIEETSAVEVEE
jgi:hydrogenase maturation protease